MIKIDEVLDALERIYEGTGDADSDWHDYDAIRRLIEQAGADWMPIESAPKDGKRILGYFPPIANAHKTYDLEVQETWWEGDRWMSIYPLHQPIRWTTLPPAPKEADHD